MEGSLYFIRERKAHIVGIEIKEDEVVDFVIEKYDSILHSYKTTRYSGFEKYIFYFEDGIELFYFSTAPYQSAKSAIEKVG